MIPVPTVLDLFSGVGGISLGAARAGFDIVGAVDHNERVVKAHARNFPSSKHLVADLGEYSGAKLLRKLGIRKPTGIVGGPPCQGFSAMGHRELTDPRNSLFGHFFRLVSEIKPRFFLAENVAGILDTDYADVIERALDSVREDYHLHEPFEVNAADYGAATNRRRIIFYGQLKASESRPQFPNFSSARRRRITVADALEGLPVKISEAKENSAQEVWETICYPSRSSFSSRAKGIIPPGIGCRESIRRLHHEGLASGFQSTIHVPHVKARFEQLREGQVDRISKAVRLAWNGLCPTLRAGTGPERGSYQAVRPIHPTEPRVITVREAARLQGFPDWFQFDPTKWHSFRMIGNSVSPLLGEQLFKQIVQNH